MLSERRLWADFQHWNNPLVVCNNRDATCGIRSRLKFHKISFNHKNIFVGENIFKCADIMAVKLLSFVHYRRRLRSFRKKVIVEQVWGEISFSVVFHAFIATDSCFRWVDCSQIGSGIARICRWVMCFPVINDRALDFCRLAVTGLLSGVASMQ